MLWRSTGAGRRTAATRFEQPVEVHHQRGHRKTVRSFAALRGLCEIAGSTAARSALKEIITAGEQLQVVPAVRNFFAQLPALSVVESIWGLLRRMW